MKQETYTAETVTLENLREVTAANEATVIRWRDPAKERPEEEAYLVLKTVWEGMPFFQEGSYEQGRFWDTAPGTPPLPERTVKGWAYPPFDDR